MGVKEIAERLRPNVESAGFQHSAKFDTGPDGVIVIDGNTISTEDAPTDCTISLSLSDLEEPGAKNIIREKLVNSYNQALGQRVADQVFFSEFVVQ